MDIYALYTFAIDIATKMGALVYHQASLACLFGAIGKSGSEKTGTYNEIIIATHNTIGNLKWNLFVKSRRLASIEKLHKNRCSIVGYVGSRRLTTVNRQQYRIKNLI